MHFRFPREEEATSRIVRPRLSGKEEPHRVITVLLFIRLCLAFSLEHECILGHFTCYAGKLQVFQKQHNLSVQDFFAPEVQESDCFLL